MNYDKPQYLLPYCSVQVVQERLVRRPFIKNVLGNYPAVWMRDNEWYYRGYAYTGENFEDYGLGFGTLCYSKEDGMNKLDKELIAHGHILLTEDRIEKLKLLL